MNDKVSILNKREKEERKKRLSRNPIKYILKLIKKDEQ